ncbi:MAG: hypothetical protein C0425_08705 [Chlorobiaceae bacterium]|nr:hypothetical protein [Chlorobiaceae bacterium]MBA4310401.1 hypothetical protein [Chlorobiaceae bacterium]
MITLILLLIILALVDSLNPFSIAIQIFLLGVLTNTHRISYYILGILLVYFVGGVLIFLGLTAYLKILLDQISVIPNMFLYSVGFVIGVILLFYGIMALRKNGIVKEIKLERKEFSILALFAIGATGTMFDLPTALPYLGFITKMIEMELNSGIGIFLLSIYSFIYIFPLLILWALFIRYKEKIKEKIVSVQIYMDKINNYVIGVFSLLIGLLFIVDAVFFFLGIPLDWY